MFDVRCSMFDVKEGFGRFRAIGCRPPFWAEFILWFGQRGFRRTSNIEHRTVQKYTGTRILILPALLQLAGCSSVPQYSAEGYEPTLPIVEQVAPAPTDGAIFVAGHQLTLFEDVKARRVGDILTVLLLEQTDAEKSSSTNIDKSGNNDISNPSLGNTILSKDYDVGIGLNSDHSFNGAGDSNQSNSLQGSITVTVAGVLPNGNLVVQGEKWIKINQGSEYIRLRGIVRPTDISTSNTIASTQVADARITYTGTGALSEANKAGWLTRFFMSPLWPF